MKCTVNKILLNKLHSGIQKWHRDQSISKEERWDYERLEESMNEYEDVLSYFEKEHNVRKIGDGRDRIIFTSGNLVQSDVETVIKISKSDGTIQNNEEVKISNKLENELGSDITEYIAPVLDYDDNYRWIVQYRAKQGSPPNSTKKIQQKFNKIGWHCSDISPDNLGLIDNETVLIDLGLGVVKK
mgnify:CR=1 FL=1